jgi:hypothetical protein
MVESEGCGGRGLLVPFGVMHDLTGSPYRADRDRETAIGSFTALSHHSASRAWGLTKEGCTSGRCSMSGTWPIVRSAMAWYTRADSSEYTVTLGTPRTTQHRHLSWRLEAAGGDKGSPTATGLH